MYQYKILVENFDPNSLNSLEKKINELAKQGWKVIKIVPHVKGSGNMIYQSFDSDYITLFLEKKIND